MTKPAEKAPVVKKKSASDLKILIAQAKPEGVRSAYADLATKHDVHIDFVPFIAVEGISSKDFRKQKIDIAAYTAVIFTSRNAIDHFFRVCDELKIGVSQDTKYFCITEAVALYLQKFILYRKRKVFYGADGSNKSLFDVINKHKDNERFLYPTSETFDSEITNWLKAKNCEYATPILYKIISNDLSAVLSNQYKLIAVFTPGAVKALVENNFQQGEAQLVVHGANTAKAATDAGYTLLATAGVPNAPGMVASLEQFITTSKTKKPAKKS